MVSAIHPTFYDNNILFPLIYGNLEIFGRHSIFKSSIFLKEKFESCI